MNELESVLKRLEKLEQQNRRLKKAGVAALLACAGALSMGQAGLQDVNFGTITAKEVRIVNESGTTYLNSEGILTGRMVILSGHGNREVTLDENGLAMGTVHLTSTYFSASRGGAAVRLEFTRDPQLSFTSEDHSTVQLDKTGLQTTSADRQRAIALTGDGLTLADGNIQLSKNNGVSLKLLDPDGKRSAVELGAGADAAMQLYGGSRLSLGSSLQGGVAAHQITLDAGSGGGGSGTITMYENGQASYHAP